MINVVTSNHTQSGRQICRPSFKGNDYSTMRQRYLNELYEESSKLEVSSILLGIGAGILTKFANKKADALGIGVVTYLASGILLNLLSSHKHSKAAKKAYKDYQKEYDEKFKPKNNIDKFVNTISTPRKMDFSSEELNRYYFFKEKEEIMTNYKFALRSLGVGALAGLISGGVLTLKNSSNKLLKSITIAAAGFATSIMGQHVAKDIKNIKKFKSELMSEKRQL